MRRAAARHGRAAALLAVGFALGTLAAGVASGELYRDARSKGVDVFFVTGRPDAVRSPTDSNLQGVGFDQGYTLITKPSGIETIPYKSGERAKIEQQGFTILANVGDQDSDLAGGHARRAFKLPNPMYFIP
jgi:hypothetical protein